MKGPPAPVPGRAVGRAGPGSAVHEGRPALLGERRHALLLVRGGEDRVEDPTLEADTLGEGGLEGAVHRLLGHHRGRRSEEPLVGEECSMWRAALITTYTHS